MQPHKIFGLRYAADGQTCLQRINIRDGVSAFRLELIQIETSWFGHGDCAGRTSALAVVYRGFRAKIDLDCVCHGTSFEDDLFASGNFRQSAIAPAPPAISLRCFADKAPCAP